MSTFNPDMLKIARDLRGMSQTELVQNMKNITQAALSKIEKGDLKPSEETKQQLAKALNFPERFFTQLDHFKVSPISLHAYRKNDLHGDDSCITNLHNPDNGAVAGLAEEGEYLLSAVAESAAESFGEGGQG